MSTKFILKKYFNIIFKIPFLIKLSENPDPIAFYK